MDPILDLKRAREDDYEKCIICHDDKHEKLLKLRERDVKYRLTIERIATIQDGIVSLVKVRYLGLKIHVPALVLMEVLDELCVVPQNQLTGLYSCSGRSQVLLNCQQ